MRTACPSCQSAYDVPDHLIGAGRLLRCAQCAHQWMVMPAAVAPAPAMPPAEAPPPPPLDPPPPRRPPPPTLPALPPPPARRPLALWGAWAASVLVLAGLGGAILLWRGEIIAAWPPAGWVLSAPGTSG